MKLGFIGIGNISSDVITGICKSKLSFKKIIISKRNLESKIVNHMNKLLNFKKLSKASIAYKPNF